MSISSFLKSALKRQSFQPPFWAILVNPFYLIRRALFLKVKKIAPQLDGVILDIGCGSKPFENLFSNAQCYIGLDIEVSGHNHRDSKVDIFYDGKTIPLDDNTVDNIVSFETMEHVFNLDDVLREAHRVLKFGGKIVISTPFGWDEHEIPFDFARYTTFGLSHILRKNGFRPLDIERTNNFIAATSQLNILYLYSLTRTNFRLLNQLAQIFIIFPFCAISLLISSILPKRQSFYSGILAVSEKV